MRIVIITLIFLGMIFSAFAQTKIILMVVSNVDFRDEELLVPKKIFEDAGYKVEIAAQEKGMARGILGAELSVNLAIDKIQTDNYEALVLVGGPGAQTYWDNVQLHSFAQSMYKQGKVIGAICLAPVCLANAGLLQNKKATVWHSEAKRLTLRGAEYLSDDVVTDGRIITASSPQSSERFAKKILEELKK